ncbi:MAG: PASTA domain-containing protein [Acutalibacteraceae bacterium]
MSLCYGCMKEIGDKKICPKCGYNNERRQEKPLLPYGTELKQRYIVGKFIDTNGESTIYLGFDKVENKKVVVREFFPIGLAERSKTDISLTVKIENDTIYKDLLKNFVYYYNTVEQLNAMSVILRVFDVFEENNTAYVIEEKEELMDFDEFVRNSGGTLEWEEARPMFMPVISALESLHKRGIGHFGISPKNLLVTNDGKLKIVGFATENERKRGTPLKSQLYSGSSAPEQYEKNLKLNIKTEIYGICAVLFYSLTGSLPNNARERLEDSRLLMSKNTVKKLPPFVVTALANGLRVEREERIKDFDELRSQLSVAPTAQALQEEISKTAAVSTIEPEKPKKDKVGMSKYSITIIACAIALVIFSIIGVLAVYGSDIFGTKDNTETTAPSTESWTGPTVEDFVGRDYEDTKESLENDSRYVVYKNYTEEYSDKIKEGAISSQTPEAGTPIKDEGQIAIVFSVSKGSKMRVLPQVDNVSLDKAASLLADAGFVTNVETQYSDNVQKDYVIGYGSGYKSGDELECNSEITIIVSKGKEEESTSPKSND